MLIRFFQRDFSTLLKKKKVLQYLFNIAGTAKTAKLLLSHTTVNSVIDLYVVLSLTT